MLTETLRKLFARDLNKLKKEIESYQNEKAIWLIENDLPNSAGNLCLHLIGNLKTYIGAELAGTGYVRNRDLEFSAKFVPRNELIKNIEETIATVDAALEKLTGEQLEAEYPALVLENTTSTGYFLVHLAAHLSYHLGQINYHRRIFDSIKNENE